MLGLPDPIYLNRQNDEYPYMGPAPPHPELHLS